MIEHRQPSTTTIWERPAARRDRPHRESGLPWVTDYRAFTTSIEEPSVHLEAGVESRHVIGISREDERAQALRDDGKVGIEATRWRPRLWVREQLGRARAPELWVILGPAFPTRLVRSISQTLSYRTLSGE